MLGLVLIIYGLANGNPLRESAIGRTLSESLWSMNSNITTRSTCL